MNRCPRCFEIAPCSRCFAVPLVAVSWRQSLLGIGFIVLFAALFIFSV